MQIKKLKLSGFKSFVDPTELSIQKGLTGIVGPNGCGKSNLLEAIRWVMGESSPKSMRGGGMEDVIFAGTETRPQRDFAEVMILAERDRDELIAASETDPDTELEIVRRIERGAGSAYRSNGRDVRAKDVALIFADAATGAHSPALVSQGKISSVISAKPTDRRQMLEEAAGISGLHVRRKDAEQKLRATENNLSRLNDILAEMDSRVGHLRRQARAAERYSKLSTQIGIAEAKLIFAKWRDAAAAADLAKQEARAADERVSAAQEAHQASVAHQNEAAKQLSIQRSSMQNARDKVNDVAQKLLMAINERDSLNRRTTDLKQQADRIEADNAREDQLTHDAAAALAKLEQEVADLGTKLEALEKERPTVERENEKAELSARNAEVELARAVAEQARVEAEIRVADAAVAAAQNRLQQILSDQERLAQDRKAVGDSAIIAKELEDAKTTIDAAATSVKAAQKDIEKYEAQREKASQKRDDAESDLSSVRAELAALQSEAAALQRDLNQDENDNKAIDRITATSGYERALAAALGDDLNAALGRNGSRYWSEDAVPNVDVDTPLGCESLLDKVDAPVALHARLAQIWVSDSDDNQPLAIGQRLVTKSGALRRWDGFVSSDDGAATAERLIRVNRLAELVKLQPAAEKKVEAAASALDNLAKQISDAQDGLKSARDARQEAEVNQRNALRQRDASEAALERQRQRSADLDERAALITDALSEAQANAAAAKSDREKLPDGSMQAAQVLKLQAEQEQSRNLVLNAQAALSSLEQQASAEKERRAVANAEIKGWNERSSEAAQRIAEMAKRAEQIKTEQEDIAQRPETLDDDIAKLEHQQTGQKEELAKLEGGEAEAETKLRECETLLSAKAEELSTSREDRAGAKARAENQELRRIEMGRISGERFECPPPVLPKKMEFDENEVGDPSVESAKLEQLNASRERIGPVNLVAAQELAELEDEQLSSHAESEELAEAINRLRGSIGQLNREGRIRLLSAFKAVDEHFQRLFTTLFNGGKAHLELIDSDDPLEAGLEIMAQPPGKKLTSLTLLSGGEQALTAVALIFGLFLTNPAPICVLDEVDAPLDDANIERFCDLLDKMSQETATRYLIVTHNAVTMSRMHRLFGVTMVEQGISRLVSVDLGAAEELLAAE